MSDAKRLSQAVFYLDESIYSRVLNGWIVLMRDQGVRRRRLEREALKVHGVAAFAFTGGEETAARTAQTICPLLTKFANMYVSEPKPFLYTFGVSGSLSRVRL